VKVTARLAHLPDAVVGLVPNAGEMIQEHSLDPPGFAVGFELEPPHDVHRVHEFSVHVELQLLERGVADPHGAAVLVAGQPWQLELWQAALTGDAVDGQELGGAAGGGAHQPLAPGIRFLAAAGGQERVQNERGVPDPAVAVVPIADAARQLRQGGGRRRDRAAGRLERQALQRDQGAHHHIAPVWCRAALVVAALRPFRPEPLGLLETVVPVAWSRPRPVGAMICEDERHARALADAEFADRGEIFAV
jgi:hypothetical protein